MQKANMNNTTNGNETRLRIVETNTDRVQVEFEIDRHIKSIRALINKLHPIERQKYFDGFLNHLLSKPVIFHSVKSDSPSNEYDLSVLNTDELNLIRELSIKMDEMYRIQGDVE